MGWVVLLPSSGHGRNNDGGNEVQLMPVMVIMIIIRLETLKILKY